MVGNAKGQGQSDDILRNRQNKGVHKSTRANHNRKQGSQYKQSKGMFWRVSQFYYFLFEDRFDWGDFWEKGLLRIERRYFSCIMEVFEVLRMSEESLKFHCHGYFKLISKIFLLKRIFIIVRTNETLSLKCHCQRL